jgi:hypothetical protein
MYKSLSILSWYPANLNIPTQELVPLQMGPKTQNDNFFKTALMILFKF